MIGLLLSSSGRNLGGAAKLYRTSRKYMSLVGSPVWRHDVNDFWIKMAACLRPVLGPEPLERSTRPDPTSISTRRR